MAKDKEDKTPLQNEVYIPDSKIRMGVYSNIANIGMTENEITISFMNSDQSGITLVSKVILPIRHAEELVKVLAETMKNFRGMSGTKAK